ncbi:hypothetical protein GCM10023162_33120 [Klenkia terrae]
MPLRGTIWPGWKVCWSAAIQTGYPAPTTGSSAPADPAATPSGVPAADVPGTPAPGVPTDVPPPTLDPGAISAGDTVVGELVQAFPDPEHDHDGDHVDEPLSWIETPEGNAVRVPTEDLPPAAAGATLAVTVGDEVADEASEDQGLAPALEVQSARVVAAATPDPTTAAAGAEATNIVTVVLVRPAGTTADSTTVDQVVDQVNGGVAAFWDEQSGGTVRISAGWGARGWVSSSASCSDPYGLWATAVSVTGWTQGPGRHLMVYVPSGAAGCAYGLGTVGSTVGSGGRSYVRDVATSVMAHELGHNFGLGHSSQYQCASTVETGSCQLNEYADYYDLMGFSWSQVGSLSTAQAALIGLLPPSEMVAFTPASAPATITLAPVSAATGTRAVKLTDSAGAVYWIEYRQASGRDAWLATSANSRRLDAGIVVRRVTADGNSTSLLLDGTPSPSSGWNADQQSALPVGSYVDIGADFAVRAQGGGVVAIGNRATVVADIDAAYARSGGATGVLRAPTSGVICGMVGSGCGRNYQGGVIYWTPGTGARTVTDPVLRGPRVPRVRLRLRHGRRRLRPGVPGRPGLQHLEHRHPRALRRHPGCLDRPGVRERRAGLPDDRRHLRHAQQRLRAGVPGRADLLDALDRHARRHRRRARGLGGVRARGGPAGLPDHGPHLRHARRRLRPGVPGWPHLQQPGQRCPRRLGRGPGRLDRAGLGDRPAGLPDHGPHLRHARRRLRPGVPGWPHLLLALDRHARPDR